MGLDLTASLTFRASGDLSAAVSQGQFGRTVGQINPTSLLSETQLRQALGISSDVLLKTLVATEPPPLPSRHISRFSLFPSLARALESDRVIAVTGYPESGKTVAMAEFASSYPGGVFWFSVCPSETHRDAWLGILLYSVAQYVGADSYLPADIRSRLVERATPMLLVIDNAQHCDDLDSLSILLEAARANSKIWVLLIGTDEPAFVSAVRTCGIVNWRLPGLTDEEARSLIESDDLPISDHQEAALKFLCLRVDGHLGMLRLSRHVIRSIQTAGQCDAFIRETSSTLGAGLDSLRSAMIERLRKGLRDEEVELCRRLSVVLGAFSRHVGESVWTVDRPKASFHASWNGCVLSVFESERSGRYTLPDLYRDGFQQEADRDAVKAWHAAIADGFEHRDDTSAELLDIHAAVVHRFLSGDIAAALESASMYLACVTGPYARRAQAFLVGRFEIWLAGAARDSNVPLTLRIRWHAIRLRVYTDLSRGKKADATARELHDLVKSDCMAAAPEAVLLAWSMLLMHASKVGQPELAMSAADRVGDSPIPLTSPDSLPWREFLVICAYLNSSTSPLTYLRTVMTRLASAHREGSLWNSMTDYAFWRATTIAVYSRSRDWNIGKEDASRLAVEIEVFAKDCLAAGELEIACLFQCLLVHVLIDAARDFERAYQTSQEAIRLASDTNDPRITAYTYDTCGDALRCWNRDDEALSLYHRALELWPADEPQDTAETLMMLGISYGKCRMYHKAVQSARAAADVYAHPQYATSKGTVKLASARCLLEAAALAIHGRQYPVAVRCLIESHGLLEDSCRDHAEWAALAQIAWSLVNRVKPEPQTPEPPAPGFTLGLGDKVVGAENMARSAPTLMLARACSAVGRSNRALSYFEAVLAECDAPKMRTQVSILALDAAIDAEDLPAATRYAILGSNWLNEAPPESPEGNERFVFDYMIGRTVRLASLHEYGTQASGDIDRAISVLPDVPTKNAAARLLDITLRAYRTALADGNDTGLEEALSLALEHRAMSVAREIAWHWCFRFSIGRPAYENQYFLWHWRLGWLSLEIGSRDVAYLEAVLGQVRNYWDRVPERSRSEATRRVLDVLHRGHTSPIGAMHMLIVELAAASCVFFNVTDVSREIAAQLPLASDASFLAGALDAFYIRLLNLLLHPGAPHVLSSLQREIASVVAAIDASANVGTETAQRFRGIQALANVLETGKPSQLAFDALRVGCSRATELSANSSAQLYIWLRHFVQFAPGDFGFGQISEVLRSPHVAKLLQDKELLPYARIRLATCHLTAKGFDAQRRLGQAIAEIETQKMLRSPIALSAVRAAKTMLESALRELESLVDAFQAVEAEARDRGMKAELWSCCLELGGLRQLVGSALLVQARDETAKDKWLLPSMEDYRRAVAAAKSLESSERFDLLIKAAFSGHTIAHALNDQTALAGFTEVIDEIRSLGGYAELIATQESFEANNVLNRVNVPRERRDFLRPADESAIQEFTDHMMQSSGWPPDRRRFVEDDVRKMAVIEREQDEYCQYLQPLQNLLHTRHPETVYATRTGYVCSCTLLGYETQIEMEDIDTVINAMKRVYCAECQRRIPGRSAPAK